jgi:hypothetical protein
LPNVSNLCRRSPAVGLGFLDTFFALRNGLLLSLLAADENGVLNEIF